MQNQLGYPCNPPPGAHRTDIIQAVQVSVCVRVCIYVCMYICENRTDIIQAVQVRE